jgi:hypothetical protein
MLQHGWAIDLSGSNKSVLTADMSFRWSPIAIAQRKSPSNEICLIAGRGTIGDHERSMDPEVFPERPLSSNIACRGYARLRWRPILFLQEKPRTSRILRSFCRF